MQALCEPSTQTATRYLRPYRAAEGRGEAFQQQFGELRKAATTPVGDVQDGQASTWDHPERTAIVVGYAQRLLAIDAEPCHLHSRFGIDA